MKSQILVLVSGAASLVLAGCGGGSSGMSGGSGVGTSPPPPVSANTPPVVSNLGADQTVLQDSTSTPVAFGISDKETAVGALKVSVQSSNPDLIDASGVDIGGNADARTLILRPKAGMAGDATITVSATDGGGMSGSQTFPLHVTTQSADYTQFVSSSMAMPQTADPAETMGKTWTDTSTDDPNAFNNLLPQ